MSLSLNEAIDYSAKLASHPSYRVNRVVPLTGSNVTISSATTESQIEIPQTVFNLSKSTIDFTLSIAAAAALHATNLNTLGASMFDSIQLSTRTGLPLAQINNVDMFTRAVNPYVTRFDDYITYDTSLGSTTAAFAYNIDLGSNFSSSNAERTATPVAALGFNSTRVRPTPANPSLMAAQIPDRSYTEPMYFKQSDIASAVVCHFSIPLKQLAPHTVMSLNKDLYFGQALILRLNWNTIAKLGWDTASAVITNTPVNITGAVTVTGARLSLQVEQNEIIRKSVIDRVMSQGMSMVVPYVHSYLYSAPPGISSTHQQRWNSSHGQKLLNIYSFVANSFAYHGFNPDIANDRDDKKVLTVQPSMNSVNLTDNPVDESKKEGYQLMKPLLDGSVIQSSDIYDYNRVHIQSYREGPCSEWLNSDDVVDGLDLDVEQNYVLNYKTNATANPYRQFMYGVAQRTMNIAPGGLVTLQ